MRPAPLLFHALAPALALAPIFGCASPPPVSSTTFSHKRPDYAPPAAEDDVREVAGDAPIPAATDPAERVVFLKAGSVWMMGPGGQDPVRVTIRSSGSPDEAPALSPRGDRVAFASAREGVSKIFLAALDGSGARAVTDGADGGDGQPAWSPDGGRLVFVRGRASERRDLCVIEVPAQGTASAKIIVPGNDDDPDRVGGPTWSPDGGMIVFSADRREQLGTGLYAASPDGGDLRRLTRPPRGRPFVRDLRATFAPDGGRLAFASNRHAAGPADADDLDLYTLDVKSGVLTRLTHDAGVADDPNYSPDGRRIYFASTREAARPYAIELYVMPADGGEQRRLTRDAVPENAAPSAGRAPEHAP